MRFRRRLSAPEFIAVLTGRESGSVSEKWSVNLTILRPQRLIYYRGEIEISDDPASKGTGDGKVFVRNRSRLSVVYYDESSIHEPVDRTSVGLDLPTPTPSPRPTATPLPTPTPIPAVNPFLLILAVSAAILIALIDRRRVRAQNG